jgi:hypothetical protein
VTIIEKAPVVSTTTANVKETIDTEFLENLPSESKTGYGNILGNHVAGVERVSNWELRARGGNVNQNQIMVDGFSLNGAKVTMNTAAALEVQTAAYGAENASTPGSVTNFVTKTGSNRFELDVSSYWEDSRLQFFTGDQDRGLVEQKNELMVNPAFSGPIIKDRLWFYVNLEGRYQFNGFGADPLGMFNDPQPHTWGSGRGTVKLTWQVTRRSKIQTFSLINREYWRRPQFSIGGIARGPHNSEPDAQLMQDKSDWFHGVTWEFVPIDTVFFKTQAGLGRVNQRDQPMLCETDPDCMNVEPIVQSFPRQLNLQNADRVWQQDERTFELVNSLEWFPRNHHLKLVSRYTGRQDEIVNGVPGDQKTFYNGPELERREIYYSNDPRLEPARQGLWIDSGEGYTFSNSIQDSWQPTRFLTFTPGLAVTKFRAGTVNQTGFQTVFDNHALTPHLSLAWDATHDSRTVLRASFNQYVDGRDSFRMAKLAMGQGVRQNCRYNPASGQFDLGCVFSGGATDTTFGLPCGPTGIGTDGQRCDEELKVPRTWEYTAGAEREIAPGWALGGDFVYRRFTYPYERRETNRIWNSSGTAVAFGGGYRSGRAQTVTDIGTPAEALRQYRAVTVTARKREGAVKASLAYTWSTLEGNVQNEDQNPFGDNPGRDPYLYGSLGDDKRHELRGSLNWQMSPWLSSGMSYLYQSGRPYQRYYRNTETGRFEDLRAPIGFNPGNNINDPGDDRMSRLPDMQRLGLQLRANLKPLIGYRLEVYGDVMNVLNLRTVTGVAQEDNAQFGQPLAYAAPFRIRIGMRARF